MMKEKEDEFNRRIREHEIKEESLLKGFKEMYEKIEYIENRGIQERRLDGKDVSDEERIVMLQRLVYQLEEQVKSFELSIETLTDELQIYQDK